MNTLNIFAYEYLKYFFYKKNYLQQLQFFAFSENQICLQIYLCIIENIKSEIKNANVMEINVFLFSGR